MASWAYEINHGFFSSNVTLLDDDDDFVSCSDDGEQWRDAEEFVEEELEEKKDEEEDGYCRLYFKGISVGIDGEFVSGIGVVLEEEDEEEVGRVQKKIGFFVEEMVAENLALLDGLVAALKSGVGRVMAVTDSELVYNQMIGAKTSENQLLTALKQRILEHASKFEAFVVRLASSTDLNKTLKLARHAIGAYGHGSEGVSCPFPDCSFVGRAHEIMTTMAGPSNFSQLQHDVCVKCPCCQRLFCAQCNVSWHSSMSCEEYNRLPVSEREVNSSSAGNSVEPDMRPCQQCGRMIQIVDGCYHMICWCGHEFCYACGAEYGDSRQTCHCTSWEDDNSVSDSPESEAWSWGPFNEHPAVAEIYTDYERSQLALIQKLLSGAFSLSDLPCQPSSQPITESYVDTMKELPWLERFVSVITDSYDEYSPN